MKCSKTTKTAELNTSTMLSIHKNKGMTTHQTQAGARGTTLVATACSISMVHDLHALEKPTRAYRA